MKNKINLYVLLVFALLFTSFPDKSNAYILNSKMIYNPLDAYYWIDPAFSNYSGAKTEVKLGISAWNLSSKIEFTNETSLPGGADVKIEYIDQYNGDTFAVSRGGGNITVYKKWRELSTSVKRQETIVHEVGHELGLAHTQKVNDSISVMREFGFNDKAYPLSDDTAGIIAKY